MPLSGLDLLLWAAGLFGHVVLLGVLWARRRWKPFPFFTALITASVVRTLLLILVRAKGSAGAYVAAYFGTQLLDTALQLAVVYEVASHVFRPLGRWAPDTHRAILAIAGISLFVAGAMTALSAPTLPNWRMTLFLRLNFFSSTLMSELFLGMVFLSVTVGLPWRTHVARIAQGLGVYSLIDVGVEAVHTLRRVGHSNVQDTHWTLVRMVVYLFCLLYWNVTLWREAPRERELPAHMTKYLREWQTRLTYDLYTLRSSRKP